MLSGTLGRISLRLRNSENGTENMSTLPPARPVSPDEVELLKKYRDLLMPAARLAGYDDFAKWLFTLTAVIGTLGAAFSNAALKSLSGTGAVLFFLAIVATGASLALAVILRDIDVPVANWQSLEDMIEKAQTSLRTKRKLAWCAGISFAVAILLAGLAPLISVIYPEPIVPHASLSYGKDGVRATINLQGNAHTMSGVSVFALLPNNEILIAAQRVDADSHGSVRLDINSASLPTGSIGFRVSLICDIKNNLKTEFVVPLQQSLQAADRPSNGLLSAMNAVPCTK